MKAADGAIGRRIRAEVLGGERAGYGEEILPTVSAELAPRYGRGFSARSLWRMVQFAEAFPDEQVVATLLKQMSWGSIWITVSSPHEATSPSKNRATTTFITTSYNRFNWDADPLSRQTVLSSPEPILSLS